MLLILAGITINILFGENGILNRAKNAKDENVIGEEKEKIALAWNGAYLEKHTSANVVNTKITADDMNKQFVANKTSATAEPCNTRIKITFADTGHVYYVYTEATDGKPAGTIEGPKVPDEVIDEIEEKIGNGEGTPEGEKTLVKIGNEVWEKDENGDYTEVDTTIDPTPGVLTNNKIQSIEDLIAFAYNVNTGKNSYEGETVTLDRNLYFDGNFNSYVNPDSTVKYVLDSFGSIIAYEPTEVGAAGTIKSLVSTKSFTPIGVGDNTFKGTFDGQGHYLAGIKFTPGYARR